jgi:uracil-DNA glycosylase family 4
MFVGEAPGRLGADASQLPFHGDRAGHNFEELLDQVGLSRYDAFVTNAVLCNPRDDAGNNATPDASEIQNCSGYLREQIELINPKIVVTLGAVSLRSTALVSTHRLALRAAVRTASNWFGRLLIPLYHPGQRAMIHRSFANQLSDYQFVVETLRRLCARRFATKRKVPKVAVSRRSPKERVRAVAARIIKKRRKLSYFSLHKLVFLAEAKHLEKTGKRLTEGYFIRQKDGPYCVELNIGKLLGLLPNLEVLRTGRNVMLRVSGQGDLLDTDLADVLSSEETKSIDDVIEAYGGMSNADLKRISYLARPMRLILRREKLEHVNLFNAPVFPTETRSV